MIAIDFGSLKRVDDRSAGKKHTLTTAHELKWAATMKLKLRIGGRDEIMTERRAKSKGKRRG